jgi:hypothetical protein
MSRYTIAVSRTLSALLTGAICSAMALLVLFATPEAMGQGVRQDTATPDNGNPFSRFFRMPTMQPAAAAPATTQPQQRVRKPRISKARKRPKPVAEAPAPADKQPAAPVQTAAPANETIADSAWPIAAASVGTATITPLTIKTVREQLEPEPDVVLVSENDLSEIDRAARLSHAEAVTPDPPVETDGSSATESDTADQARVFAMNESIKAIMHAAWLEPVLLMLAGALAGLAAGRAFA